MFESQAAYEAAVIKEQKIARQKKRQESKKLSSNSLLAQFADAFGAMEAFTTTAKNAKFQKSLLNASLKLGGSRCSCC